MKKKREAAVRQFLYSLTGGKTSGYLRAGQAHALRYGTRDGKWIAAVRVEAGELLDKLYGEADPLTLTRPRLPQEKRK